MWGAGLLRRLRLPGGGGNGGGEEDLGGSHGHVHGSLDPAIASSQRGIWATKISLSALLVTAAVQAVAEVNIAVQPDISVEAGHNIAREVHHSLLHHLRYLSNATIHVDPAGA
ncbi:MAG: hypothetical protein IH962_05025, partial [Chloroflexi bacterium]|nr:hypothetical protein [Chloroflexota bacterium]